MLSIHSSPLGELGTINTGGMSIYIRELASEISRFGHLIDIYTCADKNAHQPVVHLAGNIRLIHLSIPGVTASKKQDLFSLTPCIFNALESYTSQEKLRYDIVHSHYWLSGCLGTVIKEKWHIPHVIMFHTLELMKPGTQANNIESNKRTSQEKKLISLADKIIAPTELEKRNLIDFYNAPREKIIIIPGGVNIDLFQMRSQEYARKTINIEPGEPLIVFAGRFAPEKGIDLLFKAVQQVLKKIPVKLLVIGGDGRNDKRQQDLATLAEQLQIEEQIRFLGRIEHQLLPLYYNAADLVVMPSYYESFGLVCLEALACGTPVIANHVGIMAHILDGKTCGTTIPRPDPDSLAMAIEEYICLKKSSVFMPHILRQIAEEFSWSHVAVETVKTYNSLFSAV